MTNRNTVSPIRVDFGGGMYQDARRATAAFLDWYLMRVDSTATADTVFALLRHDIENRRFDQYKWLTDDLIRAELPAALKQAQFDDERATQNLVE